MRPSWTSMAPSWIAGAVTGKRRPAAKIVASPSGISADHLGGYHPQKVTLGAVREEIQALEGGVDLVFRPRLGLRDGVGCQHCLYAGLEQLGRGVRRGEDPPDRLRIPLLEREDHRQRHGALDEVSPY